MKNFKTSNYFLCIVSLLIVTSCATKDLEIHQTTTPLEELEELSIPNDFNFETERKVLLSIDDTTPNIKYDVFAFNDIYGSEDENIAKAMEHLLYSGKPNEGVIRQVLSLPSIYDKVYISRKDGLEYSTEIINVLNDKIDFSVSLKTASKNSKKSSTSCSDCNNNTFINGNFEDGPALPNGYTITDEKNLDGWSTTATDNKVEIWKSGFQRVPAQSGSYFVELNANQNSALYQRICTSPGSEISWSVWHRGRSGTDTAVVRIGENLANATVEATMTTGNTNWVKYSGTYKTPEDQIDTYFIFEAVSSAGAISYGNFIDNIEIIETSPGDCSNVKYKMFYPNELTNATITFEDQWPYQGDYDFNDLVINYNIQTILNEENRVIQLDFNYVLESIGGSYTNGFGVELEGVQPSAISGVTGANLTEGIINNNANGTESLQPNAVIIFFDNSHVNVGTNNTISITFTNPITTEELGTAPFNPFLIINKDRSKEIHLPNKPVTYYPTTTTIPSSPTVKDSDGNFKTSQGLPWAINISGNFKAPKEKVVITEAYNLFASWATSNGTSHKDWNEDFPGNRNEQNLKD